MGLDIDYIDGQTPLDEEEKEALLTTLRRYWLPKTIRLRHTDYVMAFYPLPPEWVKSDLSRPVK